MTVPFPALQLLTVSRNFLTYSFQRYSNNAMRKRQICPFLDRISLTDW